MWKNGQLCFSYLLLRNKLPMWIQIFQEADIKMGLDAQDIFGGETPMEVK